MILASYYCAVGRNSVRMLQEEAQGQWMMPFTLSIIICSILGYLTKHFGIYPHRKPTNTSKLPLYCDV
jgi:hypothetical protein